MDLNGEINLDLGIIKDVAFNKFESLYKEDGDPPTDLVEDF